MLPLRIGHSSPQAARIESTEFDSRSFVLGPVRRWEFDARSFTRRASVWRLELIAPPLDAEGEVRLRFVLTIAVEVSLSLRLIQHACGMACTKPGRSFDTRRSAEMSRLAASRIAAFPKDVLCPGRAASSSIGLGIRQFSKEVDAWTKHGHRQAKVDRT